MFTARYIAQDNVSWWATHSLMVTTNHTVQIDEATDGIWRRVALVPFPYKYLDSKSKDVTLRDRVKSGADGQHEAALAWIVAGARAWYDNHRALPEMPEDVRKASLAWRYESNHAARFLEDTFKPDAGSAVRTEDVFWLFQEWAKSHGLRPWNDQTFWKRATQHDWFKTRKVAKERPLTPDAWNVQRVRWDGRETARPALLTGVQAVGVDASPFSFGGTP
jgi:phage/plasmid-associated DNA primase